LLLSMTAQLQFWSILKKVSKNHHQK